MLGTVLVTGSGSITILPGTNVLMDGYYTLGFYNNAHLIAEGTNQSPILFTSTSGTTRQSWNRLYFRSSNNVMKYCEVEYGDWAVCFYGYPSTGNIVENCTLHDNDQGIRIEYTGFDIKNCEIYDNRHNVVTINNSQVDIEGTKIYNGGRDGIYSVSSSTVNIYGSVIENNGIGGTSTRNGIYPGYNDIINLGRVNYPYWNGYNTIRNNYGSEVHAYYEISQLQMMYNSVHDNDGYEVYNSSFNPTIPTMFCWWGEAPPNYTQFYGPVSVMDELESQPSWEGQTFSGQLNKPAVTPRVNLSPEEQIAHLKNLIATNSKTTQADSALVALFSIVRSDYVKDQYCERDVFCNYLSELYNSYSDYPLGKRALQYMITWKMLSGENKTAIDLSLKALDCITNPDRMGVMGNLVNLYTYSNQYDLSADILTQYKEQYKSDEAGIEFLSASLADKKEMYELEKSLAKGTTPPKEETVSLIPDKFKLYQAYPNPFNPVTQFGYAVPTKSQVRIDIYDLRGRLTETLVNQVKEPGNYQVAWDASKYPSGVYLYKIQAGTYTETKKCLLIK